MLPHPPYSPDLAPGNAIGTPNSIKKELTQENINYGKRQEGDSLCYLYDK